MSAMPSVAASCRPAAFLRCTGLDCGIAAAPAAAANAAEIGAAPAAAAAPGATACRWCRNSVGCASHRVARIRDAALQNPPELPVWSAALSWHDEWNAIALTTVMQMTSAQSPAMVSPNSSQS